MKKIIINISSNNQLANVILDYLGKLTLFSL